MENQWDRNDEGDLKGADSFSLILNQEETRKFTEEISDPIVRMLMEGAVSSAIIAWVTDPVLSASLRRTPIDLLVYARGMYRFFSRRDLVQRILSGEYRSLEDIAF